MIEDLPDLVALKVADHVKAVRQKPIPLSEILMHTVLADVGQTRRQRFVDTLRRQGLGHGHECDIPANATAPGAGARDPVLDMQNALGQHKKMNIFGARLNSKDVAWLETDGRSGGGSPWPATACGRRNRWRD